MSGDSANYVCFHDTGWWGWSGLKVNDYNISGPKKSFSRTNSPEILKLVFIYLNSALYNIDMKLKSNKLSVYIVEFNL